jgi:hypothetical protein
VSFIQSVLICSLAFYVRRNDPQRDMMGWKERVYGYSGGEGMVQAFSCGYFLWDLYVCVRYYGLFGFGMLAHAISSLLVYSAGFVSRTKKLLSIGAVTFTDAVGRDRLSTTTPLLSFCTSCLRRSSTFIGSATS